jgi:hypothetical protein
MDTDLLNAKCEVLEEIVIDMAKIYNRPGTLQEVKSTMENMVGNAIRDLPGDETLFSGKISIRALLQGIAQNKLSEIKHIRIHRPELVGKILLSEKYRVFASGRIRLVDLYLNVYGKYHVVLEEEERDLVRYQEEHPDVENDIAYNHLGIKLEDSMELLKGIIQTRNLVKTEPWEETEHEKNIFVIPELPIRLSIDSLNIPESITGVRINGVELETKSNTTACYRAFMNYIIDQFSEKLQYSSTASELFKRNPEDLGSDYINYPNVINERGGYYYNSHAGSKTKIRRMLEMSEDFFVKIELIL